MAHSKPKAPLAGVACYIVAGLAAAGGFYQIIFALGAGGVVGTLGVTTGLGALGGAVFI